MGVKTRISAQMAKVTGWDIIWASWDFSSKSGWGMAIHAYPVTKEMNQSVIMAKKKKGLF